MLLFLLQLKFSDNSAVSQLFLTRTQPVLFLHLTVEFIQTAGNMDNQNQPTNLIYQERHSIYQERLRQARSAFNLAFGLTTVSAIAGFAGVVLLFSGNVSAGTLTAAGGGIYGSVTASWLKLAKDANDRLDEAARALEAES
ncbi:hypothetical protein NIES4073_41220 [Kalymmatonema gypsitolerans NIES-4073]|nr:hypothetical protein NIES4073_41220 [Scytonema sp. NIES-4073]